MNLYVLSWMLLKKIGYRLLCFTHSPDKNLQLYDEIAEQNLKPAPTFGLYADTFLTKIIVTVHSYSPFRADFFSNLSRSQF